MKAKHRTGARLNARETLRACNLNTDGSQGFHTLSRDQVNALLKCADRARHQAPPDANGSRARSLYERLQRHARLKIE